MKGIPGVRVSVIIVNHNRCRLLQRCVESLLAQSYPDFEIVVVDNASHDSSLRWLSTLSHPRLRIVALPENRGFSGGCNAGLKAASGRLIALLNNDAEAHPTWLEQLVRGIEATPWAGMCASKILFRGTGFIDKAGHLMFADGQNRGRGTGEPDCGQYDMTEEAFFPDGCAALYRRQLLEELEGFDEVFFAYADDADLGMRARWRGWRCLYVPGAVVYHDHSATSGRFSAQKIYWVERNRLWLAVKNFPLPLLLLNPLLTLYRWGWNFAAAILSRGPAGLARREESMVVLIRSLLRAYRDALKDVGRMFSSRRRIRAGRTISDRDFYRLLWRFRISARDLAFKEFQGP